MGLHEPLNHMLNGRSLFDTTTLSGTCPNVEALRHEAKTLRITKLLLQASVSADTMGINVLSSEPVVLLFTSHCPGTVNKCLNQFFAIAPYHVPFGRGGVKASHVEYALVHLRWQELVRDWKINRTHCRKNTWFAKKTPPPPSIQETAPLKKNRAQGWREGGRGVREGERNKQQLKGVNTERRTQHVKNTTENVRNWRERE